MQIYSQEVPGIIFEDDFAADTGFTSSADGTFQTGASEKPTKWDGLKANSGGSIEVVAQGVGGSNCVKLNYASQQQPVCSLAKHLTGDVNTGFDELYIRYRVKFDDNFKAGDGDGTLSYWKWGRLWQNTGATNDGTWSENRVDSKYIVWNFGSGNAVTYQTNLAVTWGANSGSNLHLGSSGGERFRTRFDTSGGAGSPKDGHFENMGSDDWDLDWTNTPSEPAGRFVTTPQDWHTIEYRFKLATSDTANDGEQQIWFDGVDQNAYSDTANLGGASGITGPPTARDGSGMNFLVVFDNVDGWDGGWGDAGVDAAIRINDVVVSRARIGHSYNVGG